MWPCKYVEQICTVSCYVLGAVQLYRVPETAELQQLGLAQVQHSCVCEGALCPHSQHESCFRTAHVAAQSLGGVGVQACIAETIFFLWSLNTEKQVELVLLFVYYSIPGTLKCSRSILQYMKPHLRHLKGRTSCPSSASPALPRGHKWFPHCTHKIQA